MLDVAQLYIKSKTTASVVNGADAPGSKNQQTMLTHAETETI